MKKEFKTVEELKEEIETFIQSVKDTGDDLYFDPAVTIICQLIAENGLFFKERQDIFNFIAEITDADYALHVKKSFLEGMQRIGLESEELNNEIKSTTE